MNPLPLSILVAVSFLAISKIAEGQALPKCVLSSPQAQSGTETRNEAPSNVNTQESLRPRQRDRFVSRRQPQKEPLNQPAVQEQPIIQQPDFQQFDPQAPQLANREPLLVKQPDLQQFEPQPSKFANREPLLVEQPDLEQFDPQAPQFEGRQPLLVEQPELQQFNPQTPHFARRQPQQFQQPQVPDRRPVHRLRPQQRQVVQQPQPQPPQVGGGSEQDAVLSRYGYDHLGNGKYAVVVNAYGTWQQALLACESHLPGATLFMANLPEDSAWLGQRINFEKDRITGASKFWVGLTSRGPNGPLHWLDGDRYRNYREVVQVSGYDDSTKRFAWAVPDSFTKLKYEFLTADDEAESYICQYEL